MSTIRPVIAALLIAGPAAAQITNDPFPDPIAASEGVIVVGLEEFAGSPRHRRSACPTDGAHRRAGLRAPLH